MTTDNPSTGASLHPISRTEQEWEAYVRGLGHPSYRGRQIYRWIHQKGVLTPAEMSNVPQVLREQLQVSWSAPLMEVVHEHTSADGTTKLALKLTDGNIIETVLIPVGGTHTQLDADAAVADMEEDTAGDAADERTMRVTQCISTQVGCAMGCAFCASGANGLMRNLRAEEIVSQVLLARRKLTKTQRLSNVVLMGMGEPLHNYKETVRSLTLLTARTGIGLSNRRVTVSTVGLVPQIDQLGQDFAGKVGLAVSLHAADDETRSKLVPLNKRYPLREIIRALRRYPLPPRRRITIEYALIDGVNDRKQDALALARLLRGLPVKVNLIPLNPVEHSNLSPSPEATVQAFRTNLVNSHLTAFVRKRRGDEISAACGQLAGKLPKS